MFRFFNRRAAVNGSAAVAAAVATAYDDTDGEGGNTAVALSDVEHIRNNRRKTDRDNVLTVGVNVSLQGKVRGCAMLLVEGAANINAKDCGALVVAETGHFDGSAEVSTAEIAGQVTGNITCTGQLVLRSTGRVKGKIRYGALEIETGGDLGGNVAALPAKSRATAGEPFFGLERFAK